MIDKQQAALIGDFLRNRNLAMSENIDTRAKKLLHIIISTNCNDAGYYPISALQDTFDTIIKDERFKEGLLLYVRCNIYLLFAFYHIQQVEK